MKHFKNTANKIFAFEQSDIDRGLVPENLIEITDVEKDEILSAAQKTEEANRVPSSVSRRQAKQALVLAGMYNSVQPAIGAIEDETERLLAQIFWDDSNTFERDNPKLLAIAGGLGLTETQIDDLFRQASEL